MMKGGSLEEDYKADPAPDAEADRNKSPNETKDTREPAGAK